MFIFVAFINFCLFSEIHWWAGSNHTAGRIRLADRQLDHTVEDYQEIGISL